MTERRPVLSVRNLKVGFENSRGTLQVLEGVDFSLSAGEILALVGETGCGKSVTAKTILNLMPQLDCIRSGEIFFQNQNLMTLSNRELQRIRGRAVTMIFQNPQASINPVFTLGEQIYRLICLHLKQEIHRLCQRKGLNQKAAVRQIAIQKLSEVGLTEIEGLLESHAHKISGGMAQRYKIALALIGSPNVLIADEATSALDVTVQAHILALLKEISRQKDTAILFITHDMGIAAQICDRVAVMYAGRVVETGATLDIFKNPLHPYTRGLLKAVPRLGKQEPLLFIPGKIPDLSSPPSGCRFHPRCGNQTAVCRTRKPPFKLASDGHSVACHLYAS